MARDLPSPVRFPCMPGALNELATASRRDAIFHILRVRYFRSDFPRQLHR
jgi:hypothetical protein